MSHIERENHLFIKETHTYVLLWVIALVSIPSAFQGCGILHGSHLTHHNEDITNFDRGIRNVSLNVMTTSRWSPFSKGSADHISYEYDDTYNLTDIDFFNFKDPKLYSIHQHIQNQTRFYIIAANGFSNNTGFLKINSQHYSIEEYQKSTEAFLKGNLKALPAFTLGKPIYKGDVQLKEFKLIYTGQSSVNLQKLQRLPIRCAYNNHPGPSGEYRSGALVFQAVDAKRLYFMKKTNTVSPRGGLLWEASIFRDGSKGPCHFARL